MPKKGIYSYRKAITQMSETTERIRKLVLPCIATRQMVVFPGTAVNLNVARAASKKACEAAMHGDNLLFVVCQKDATVQTPEQDDLYTVGTIVKIAQLVKSQGTNLHIVVVPRARACVETVTMENGKYLTASIIERTVAVEGFGDAHGEALVRDIRRLVGDFMKLMPKFSKDLWFIVNTVNDPGLLADFVADPVYDLRPERLSVEDFINLTLKLA